MNCVFNFFQIKDQRWRFVLPNNELRVKMGQCLCKDSQDEDNLYLRLEFAPKLIRFRKHIISCKYLYHYIKECRRGL